MNHKGQFLCLLCNTGFPTYEDLEFDQHKCFDFVPVLEVVPPEPYRGGGCSYVVAELLDTIRASLVDMFESDSKILIRRT